MRFEDTLILERKDLLEQFKTVNIDKIESSDFKTSYDIIQSNNVILFIDNDGTLKIIKNGFKRNGI